MSSAAWLRSLGEVVGRRGVIRVGFAVLPFYRSIIHPAGHSLQSLAIQLPGYYSVKIIMPLYKREDFIYAEEERKRVVLYCVIHDLVEKEVEKEGEAMEKESKERDYYADAVNRLLKDENASSLLKKVLEKEKKRMEEVSGKGTQTNSDIESITQSFLRRLERWSEELEKGGEELEKGGEELKKGSEELKKGSEELKKGSEELKKGSEEVKKGSEEVKKGSEEMKKGSEEMQGRENNPNNRELMIACISFFTNA